MSKSSPIFVGLTNILRDLEEPVYNVILSIGSDSGLNWNIDNLYRDMIVSFKNSLPTILIIFSNTTFDDFPDDVLIKFLGRELPRDRDENKRVREGMRGGDEYYKYGGKKENTEKDSQGKEKKKDKEREKIKENKDNFSIYLIPHYLPIESLKGTNAEELTNFMSSRILKEESDVPDVRSMLRNYPDVDLSNDSFIRLKCRWGERRVWRDISKIDVNNFDSFLNKNYMKLLTRFCVFNLRNGGHIRLINNFVFNDREMYQDLCRPEREARDGGDVPISVFPYGQFRPYINGNEYLTKCPYFYHFISILSRVKSERGQFSFSVGRNLEDNLYFFRRILNLVSYPKFFNIDLSEKHNLDWIYNDIVFGRNSVLTEDVREYSGDINLPLERNILTSGDVEQEISIPRGSFSTASGREWLDSYAVIVGINNILKRVNHQFREDDVKRCVVCIPDIQYSILPSREHPQGQWSTIKDHNLLDGCRFLFIPINVGGIHWTLLMIDQVRRVGYHFDSLFKFSDKESNTEKDYNKKREFKTEKKYFKDSDKNLEKEDKYSKKSKKNNEIAKNIFNLILGEDGDYLDIYLHDQRNDYDCGIFILIHLSMLLERCITNPDDHFGYYLIDKVIDNNFEDDISKYRFNISKMLGDSDESESDESIFSLKKSTLKKRFSHSQKKSQSKREKKYVNIKTNIK